jgi:hypothetical protein
MIYMRLPNGLSKGFQMSANAKFYTVDEIKDRQSMSTVVFWKYRPIGERAMEELARHGIRKERTSSF